jgi:hypothetical protein
MVISKLLKSSPAVQYEWLKGQLLDKTLEDMKSNLVNPTVKKLDNLVAKDENVIDYINYRAWDIPLGAYIIYDHSSLNDMLENPESYDLGWSIQAKMENMSDHRAEEINNGDQLSSDELNVAVRIVEEMQDEEDDWISCAGFKINTIADGTIFAAFTGLSLGQGGIEYTFYKLFPNTETAVSYFSEKGDNWFSI